MRSRTAALAALCLLASAGRSIALDLHDGRSSPYDLALSGRLAGVPAGETRYVRWKELRSLPTAEIAVDGEFVKGPEVLTVVYLGDLWKALPVAPGADAVLASCTDGYASVYTSEFISRYRPFLVLEIDGKGPGDWPPPGLAFNPGPYVISVSAALVPEAARYRDLQHKKPWGVAALEFASYADRFRPFYTGKWASPGPSARTGREIWINSCASCHQGPAGVFGGSKAGRPFEVVAAYAGYDRDFFLKYMRDPKSLVASAKMPPQPQYTDGDLSGLIAFLTARPE